MAAVLPTLEPRIGRYLLARTLGEGTQGRSHLATDTRLQRQVVLKVLAVPSLQGRARRLADLRVHARAVGALAHPHIVPLFDAGDEEGTPYLVFEYVAGESLAALIAREGRLETARAVGIAAALANALAYAHERGIVHRQLRTSKVMITPEGAARLTDFGIAPPGGAPADDDAPERVAADPEEAAGDVLALGGVLYEMLCGVPPAASAVAPASRHNAEIDEELDGLVMKALARAAHERFAGAADFAAALQAYQQPADEPPPESSAEAAKGTLDYLLRRIRHKGEFPALSATVSAVNRAATSDREPVAVLCNSILKDVALTSRLLKIVNSSHLNQFGGEISTVSRAISILGYDAVRNVSMSLVLFEHLHDRANAAALKDQVVSIYFSGLLARELHARADLRDPEQAFICAMFHRLGKLLVTFYLHDEAAVIERHVQTRGWDDERAAKTVLGIGYEEIGVGVAKAWNFPPEIIDSMHPVTGTLKKCPGQPSEKLRMIATMANELADVVQCNDEAGRKAGLADIVARYGGATGVSDRSLVAAVQSSTENLLRDAECLGHGVARNGFVRSARSWQASEPPPAAKEIAHAADASGAEEASADAPAGGPAVDEGDETDSSPGGLGKDVQRVAEAQRLVAEAQLGGGEAAMEHAGLAAEPGRRQAALAAGVQDITNTLVGDHSLNDVLRIILETMYRSIGFHRVLLFVRDERMQTLRCRFGFGADADAIVQGGVAAPLGGSRDLFYAAVVLGADLCIDDLEAPKVRQHVPQWYRDSIGARGIVLLPIVNRKRTLGLIYADSDTPGILRFSPEELGLLKTLRNQAVLAMRQLA